MFKDLSVKHRLVLGFACVLGLMALVVFTTGNQFTKSRKAIEVITETLTPQVRAADALAVAVYRESTTLRGYILGGGESFLTDYRIASVDVDSAIQDLKSVLTEPDDTAMLLDIQTELVQMRQDEARVLSLFNRGDSDGAFQHYKIHIRPAAASMSHIAGRIALEGHNRIDAANEEYRDAVTQLKMISWVSLIVAFLLAAVFTVATIRSVGRPARSIASAASAVAKGDYPTALALERTYGLSNGKKIIPRNELRQIALALVDMARTLERRERNLAAHADIGMTCASTVEIDRLLEDTLDDLTNCTNSQVAAVYYYGDDGRLSARGTYGISPELVEAAVAEPNGLVAQVAQSAKTSVLSDIPDDVKFLVQPGLGKAIPKSIACVPMLVEGESVGVIVLASLYGYDQESISFMETSAIQLGVAISNALRHEHVLRLADELQSSNEKLDAQNEELQCQNEEIQSQSEELAAQSNELRDRCAEMEAVTQDLMALQSVTATALTTLEQEELLGRLMGSITGTLNLQFGMVMLLDEAGGTLRAGVGHNIVTGDEEVFELRIGEGLAGRVAESREVISTNDVGDVEPLLLSPYIRQSGVRALIGLPLISSGNLLGVVLLGAMEPREFSDREKHLMEVFAARCAIAIERAQDYEKVKAAEKMARSERRRLQTIIDNMPEAVIIVDAPDGHVNMMNKVAFSLYGLDETPFAEAAKHAETFNLYTPNGRPIASDDLPLSKSLLKGETCKGVEVMIRRPDGEEIVVLCNTSPIRDSSGEIVGAVAIFQDITAIKEQQRLLQEVYEQERYIAQTLQKSFLPSVKPVIDGYDIADAYVPARTGAQVGGDFYDLIDLGEDRLGVVMADVSGKGVTAAVHTAMAKYMLRGFAMEDSEPAEVMTRLNRVIARCVHREVFVTLFYGVLYTRDRKLVYANAGHERPILVRPKTGGCAALPTTGPALGIIPDSTYTQMEIEMSEGDAFVLYTDGITEARREKEFLGQERLEALISEMAGLSADKISGHILASVQDYTNGDLHDDVALVVIRPCSCD